MPQVISPDEEGGAQGACGLPQVISPDDLQARRDHPQTVGVLLAKEKHLAGLRGCMRPLVRAGWPALPAYPASPPYPPPPSSPTCVHINPLNPLPFLPSYPHTNPLPFLPSWRIYPTHLRLLIGYL